MQTKLEDLRDLQEKHFLRRQFIGAVLASGLDWHDDDLLITSVTRLVDATMATEKEEFKALSPVNEMEKL